MFVSAFSPLSLVLVAITSSLLLDEDLYVGRYGLVKIYIDHSKIYINGTVIIL